MKKKTQHIKQNIQIFGHHLGGRLDLKKIKNSLSFQSTYSDPTETMYRVNEGEYFRIFDYGSIVFFNIDHTTQTRIITSIRQILGLEAGELMTENFNVEVDTDKPYDIVFDRIIIQELNMHIVQILMLNIAQSVALDFYAEQSNTLLDQTNQLSLELEAKGKFSIKGRNLLRYIGRTLTLKSKIAQNLYIFDSPDITWDNQFLNTLNNDLGRELDIKIRHRSLQENLNTVRENLEIFQNISQHYHSTFLEWIVIVLIAVEIANVFIERVL